MKPEPTAVASVTFFDDGDSEAAYSVPGEDIAEMAEALRKLADLLESDEDDDGVRH